MKNTIEVVSSIREEVYIYGTGLAAQMGCRALERLSVNCIGFIDADEEKWGHTLCGREIKGLNQTLPEQQILIMANPKYEIHERLNRAGYHKWMYVDAEILREYTQVGGGYFNLLDEILKKNSRKIRHVYNMLADERSRVTFEYVFMHRMNHRLELISKIYEKNQYFGNDLIPKAEGSIVDCGAYTGDTLERFLNQRGSCSNYQYYAFEAEKKNYDTLLNRSRDILNVEVYNMAVWDKQGNLSFEGDENTVKTGGRVTENSNDASNINADSLDNVIGDKEVNLITMDIEGAEIRALKGAERIIKNWHPCLAVSAYHKVEHLWEIPLLIKEMNDDDYQIYFRHHRWNIADTVCYAIPKKGNFK